MGDIMKEYLDDILYCLKVSLYFFAAPFIIGAVIGLILHGKDIAGIIVFGCRIVQYIAVLGLALAGISFLKQDLMRPLNHQKQWETYFNRLNLAFVILFVSVFIASFSYLIESFI